MPYSITEVIYGFTVIRGGIADLMEEANLKPDDFQMLESVYHANGPSLHYCGVKLGDYSECDPITFQNGVSGPHLIKGTVTEVPLYATDEQSTKAEELKQAFDEALGEIIDQYEEDDNGDLMWNKTVAVRDELRQIPMRVRFVFGTS